MFPVRNGKGEHRHWILHIRISLDTKFQLNLAILILWNKFARKGFFRPKTDKSIFYMRPWLLLTILNFFFRTVTDRHNVILMSLLLESAKLRGLRAHVPTRVAYLRANGPCVFTCQRAKPTCLWCLCSHVSTCLACSRAHVPTCLACLRAHVL